ncbi:MAG: hypothetical protein IJ091_00610 [Oscillospiraceae bacterium]|nr:hypothetical protein [Oscillospiraceae bacterium]
MSFDQVSQTIIRGAMIFLAIYVVLTMGEGLFPKVKRRYTHRSYADGGLWFDKKDLPKGSLDAVMHATDLKYGSRLDIRLTRDDIPVVFSDKTLELKDTGSVQISDTPYEELQELLVKNSASITRLEDILAAMEAREDRAPLLLNLEPDSSDPKAILHFCEVVTKVFYPYRYFCAVESHNTDVIGFYARNYSNIVRGLRMLSREDSDLSEKEYKALNRMMRNMKTRPQFFDTSKELYNLYYWVPVTMGSFVIMRGVTDEDSRIQAKKGYGVESVIFTDGAPKAEF